MEINTNTTLNKESDVISKMISEIVLQIDNVFIDKKSEASEVASRFKKYFPKEKIKIVTEEPFTEKKGELSAKEFSESKRNIYIKKFEGSFFKRCPGARPQLTCCNYFVLNLGQQCNFNCSYCYLQSFINNPLMHVYSNINQALEELREIGEQMSDQTLRVGTGEVIDSLSLDPLTGYSQKLICFFKDYPKWRLEFKTKSQYVDQFINETHNNNIITSWSINPEKIITQEEHKTASLKQRLRAAKKCQEKGFLVSFHIDPVIWHPDWEINYTNMVAEITSLFQPKDLPYLSIGALRFQPQQMHIMRERFGMKSLVTSAEVFASKDGKLRYDKTLRQKMFKKIIEEFKKHSPDWNIFLCMESPETWLRSANHLPKSSKGISDLFNHQVVRSAEKIISNSTKKQKSKLCNQPLSTKSSLLN